MQMARAGQGKKQQDQCQGQGSAVQQIELYYNDLVSSSYRQGRAGSGVEICRAWGGMRNGRSNHQK